MNAYNTGLVILTLVTNFHRFFRRDARLFGLGLLWILRWRTRRFVRSALLFVFVFRTAHGDGNERKQTRKENWL